MMCKTKQSEQRQETKGKCVPETWMNFTFRDCASKDSFSATCMKYDIPRSWSTRLTKKHHVKGFKGTWFEKIKDYKDNNKIPPLHCEWCQLLVELCYQQLSRTTTTSWTSSSLIKFLHVPIRNEFTLWRNIIPLIYTCEINKKTSKACLLCHACLFSQR